MSGLDRRLGPLDGAAVVVSNVIGSGIFLLPAVVAGLTPHPWWMIGAWVAGGALAFAGAMAYAELAALRPRAGGEYVYLREAFGPLPAFLTGWTSFVAGFSGAIAVGAVGFATYLGRLLPAAGDTEPWAVLPLGVVTLSVSPQSLAALAVIGVLTVVHLVGLGPGRVVQNLLAVMKVAVLAAFVALGFALGEGSVANFSMSGEAVSGAGWLLALLPVMFAYSGWNAASYLAEEIRDPGRNVPLALGLGTAAVVVIYVLLNLLYVYAPPGHRVRRRRPHGRRGGRAPVRSGAAAPVAAASAVMIAASLSAMVFAGPRVYYAMARDRQFFAVAAAVHPRFRTPTVAIAAQSAWAGLLVLSGTFGQLVDYTAFAVVLFAGVAVGALFVLRFREPDAHRPFRAWGYPAAPLVFVVVSAALVVNAIRINPEPSLAGIVLIAAGIPVYFLTRSGASRGS